MLCLITLFSRKSKFSTKQLSGPSSPLGVVVVVVVVVVEVVVVVVVIVVVVVVVVEVVVVGLNVLHCVNDDLV